MKLQDLITAYEKEANNYKSLENHLKAAIKLADYVCLLWKNGELKAGETK